MAIIDNIYANVDDFGLIASWEARRIGISNAEMVQQAHRGKLLRVARGVYRMPIWPYQEAAPYAIAVKAAGERAFLYGESVVALLGLAPTDPTRIFVASPDRVRRCIGENVAVLGVRPDEPTAFYEGILCQRVDSAILAAVKRLGYERSLEAANAAHRNGYIAEEVLNNLKGGLL